MILCLLRVISASLQSLAPVFPTQAHAVSVSSMRAVTRKFECMQLAPPTQSTRSGVYECSLYACCRREDCYIIEPFHMTCNRRDINICWILWKFIRGGTNGSVRHFSISKHSNGLLRFEQVAAYMY